MDNSGAGAGDDQGSGWFQVKKKHRSSSKFSIRNWVEGSSRLQANGKGRNSDNKNQSDVSKPGTYCVQRSVAGQSSTSKEDGKDECCLEKRVVAGDNGCVKTHPLKIIIAANSESTSVDNENLSHKKPDILHRIKWGDLEDDALAPTDGSSIVSEIRFGEIGDDDLAMCGTSRNLYDVSRCNSSKDCPVASKEIVEVLNVADDACNNMLDTHKDSLDENCKEVIEVSSSNVEKLSISSNVVDETSNDLDGKEVDSDHAEPLNKDLSCIYDPSADEFPCSFAEGPAETGKVSGPVFKPALGGSGISSLRADDGDTEVIIAEDPAILASSDRSMPEATGNSNSAAADSGCSATSKDSFPNAPLMKTVGDQVEGESKERFRERLWSFLFENLNRAIDELYLLCELECDMEQVKEAILVLQEAESDFRELNIRVEEFDKMKKNACQSTSGAVLSTKADRRRPHALSWEVRRMTTSPHRAEILSSSLEAFKKIQEERAKERAAVEAGVTDSQLRTCSPATVDVRSRPIIPDASELESKLRRKSGFGDVTSKYRRDTDSGRSSRTLVQNSRLSPSTSSDQNTSKLPPRRYSGAPLGVKGTTERLGSLAEVERHSVSGEFVRRHSSASEKEKDRDRRNSQSWKPSDAWKEKRNWEEILASTCRLSSRHSYSPSMSRKSAERARILHDKLMSPEKKKKTALDLKKEAEEKHARAMRIRSELESERIQKLQRTSEKLNRVTERQAVRSMKLKEGMYARHQRSESRHEAYLANVAKRAGDESNKVNEVRFITSLNEETKKFLLRQKLHGSELRRAEKYQVFKTKQKEDMAREEAVMERRKLIEAEKLQRLAETQKRKEEAQLRREEERKASSAAREARAMEQLRRKEERAKAQQEESELLAQRLAERLRESEQRRKVYLEQIRERASMDFRDQSSPLLRRVVNKEGQGRTTPPKNADDNQENSLLGGMDSGSTNSATGTHQSLKRRIKKIRQRLMALKHDLPETSVTESVGIGYRTGMATARAKIGRWLQELQRLRQERKEGAASIGLIAAEMIKFLEGKELEQLAARRAGLLDFISSALPASHISKPEACQVTIYLLKLLKVVLFVPANRSYFLAQNLLPPLIPMLSAALESYIKIAASLNISGSSNSQLTKTSSERFESISEVLDGFLCTVSMIIGLPTFDERQRQMQDGLLELVVSYQIIHRLRDLFALYDRPQVEGSPFPSSILLSINLFVVLTSRPCPVSSIDWDCFLVSENKTEQSGLMKNSGCPLEDNSQDGLQLPSSAVIGHSSGISGAEQGDSPDELHKTELVIDSKLSGEAIEVEQGYTPIDLNCNSKDTGVERLDFHKDLETSIINVNIPLKEEKTSSYTGIGRRNEQHVGLKQPHAFILSAISETGLISLPSLLTAVLLQANSKSSEQGSYVLPSNFEEVATGVLKVLNNLALMDITFMQQMLARPDLKMEFFHTMSFLLTHCTNSWKVASDQVGLLLLESLLLLGYFSLFHPGNQAVLRWGSSPTILHKVCDLPFAFFSDPQLMPILGGTLVAACYGCERNKGVVQQELSTEMILSVVKASRSSLPRARSNSPSDKPLVEDSTLEPRKQQSDISVKPIRSNGRNTRLSMTKGGTTGSSINRVGKLRQPKDGKSSKISEDGTSKLKVDTTSEAPVTLPLYARFPGSFVERAEQFFSSEPDSDIYNAHV